MSTYSLSGSGTHALSAGTTGLQVTITTVSVIGGIGRSSPTARYDQGLLRFSDGTSYWAPVPILGGPQFIPVPANATSMGYALLGGAVVSIIEVIGGTVFFSFPIQSVATLSDVLLASLADGQTLAWNAAASKWENTTPAGGSAGDLVLISRQLLVASAASVTFASIPDTYKHLRATWHCRADAAGVENDMHVQLNGDTGANYDSLYAYTGGGVVNQADRIGAVWFWVGDTAHSGATAEEQGDGALEIRDYTDTTTRKSFLSEAMCPRTTGGAKYRFFCAGTWRSTAAVTSLSLLPASGNWVANSEFSLYGLN